MQLAPLLPVSRGAQSVADIAEAGVGRKAVVAAEVLLGTSVASDTSTWYRSQYVEMAATDTDATRTWEVHSVRADVTPRADISLSSRRFRMRQFCEVKPRGGLAKEHILMAEAALNFHGVVCESAGPAGLCSIR